MFCMSLHMGPRFIVSSEELWPVWGTMKLAPIVNSRKNSPWTPGFKPGSADCQCIVQCPNSNNQTLSQCVSVCVHARVHMFMHHCVNVFSVCSSQERQILQLLPTFSLRSSAIQVAQVLLGLPFGLFPSITKFIALFIMWWSAFRWTCPNQRSLLVLLLATDFRSSTLHILHSSS